MNRGHPVHESRTPRKPGSKCHFLEPFLARQAMDGAQGRREPRRRSGAHQPSAWTRWRPLEITPIARRAARTAAGGDGAAVRLASAQDARCTMAACAVADWAGARKSALCHAAADSPASHRRKRATERGLLRRCGDRGRNGRPERALPRAGRGACRRRWPAAQIVPRSSSAVAPCRPFSRMMVRNRVSGVMSWSRDRCMSSSALR